MFTEQEAIDLIDKQQECWPIYKERMLQLENIQTKEFKIGAYTVIAQHNPARAVSSGAKVDKQSIEKRPCFLCSKNRPKEQIGINILDNYTLLVNPFPILKGHYTIVNNRHTQQTIYDKIGDLLSLCQLLPSHLVFYNGPKCGASAPDHLHFQAIKKGQLPIEKECRDLTKATLSDNPCGSMSVIQGLGRRCIVIESGRKDMATSFFHQLYLQLPKAQEEPMMNVIGSFDNDKFILYVFCRKAHRPSQYFNEDDPWMISPGAIDMGGVLVLAQEKDFNRISSQVIEDVYKQVSL